jgi:hypothetical protein
MGAIAIAKKGNSSDKILAADSADATGLDRVPKSDKAVKSLY